MPEMSAAEAESLCKKLEGFSASLTDNERTLFKRMFTLERGRLSEKALDEVYGGAGGQSQFQPLRFQSVAPRLDVNFFKLLSW
jgi:hypothetical protein